MQLKLLISPLAKAAYFADYLTVAAAEFQTLFANVPFEFEHQAGLDFMRVDLSESDLAQLVRMSFLQAVFQVSASGMQPLEADKNFALPEELIYGFKYAGKTNETVTQLALNLALHYGPAKAARPLKLLDPMAGKGTSVLWAMRYGCEAIGIEQNKTALAGFQQHIKKQCKLLRLKHRQSDGFIGKPNRQDTGKFLQFEIASQAKNSNAETEYQTARLITGDSTAAKRLIQNKTVSLIVADLPYGVQHVTTSGSRNPLPVIEACAKQWVDCLVSKGVMVLIFNSYQPKRQALIDLFSEHGLQVESFSAAHRMSESIVRDLVVFTKP